MLVVERMIELRLLCNNFAYFLECLLATKLEFTLANFDINKVCFFFVVNVNDLSSSTFWLE